MTKPAIFETIQTKEIRLVDNQNRMRMRLTGDFYGDGPIVQCCDTNGRSRVMAGISKDDRCFVTLFRKDGNVSIALGASNDGESAITVFDSLGQPGIQMAINADGSRHIEIVRSNGERSVIWNEL